MFKSVNWHWNVCRFLYVFLSNLSLLVYLIDKCGSIQYKSLVKSPIDSVVIYQPNKDEDAFDVSFLAMEQWCQNANVILPTKLVRPKFYRERDIAERKYFRRIYQNRLAKLDTVVYDLPLTQLLMYLFLQWNNDVIAKNRISSFRQKSKVLWQIW